MQASEPDHYIALGLDRRCTDAQIRVAYRLLAKQHHPDVNPASPDAMARTQAINAAYEILSDPERRRAYDESRIVAGTRQKPAARAGKLERNVSQEVHLRIEEFFRGTSLEIHVNDPGNPEGPEIYPLEVPPETTPGARFRIRREGPFSGGRVLVRVRARPDFRFKIRGSDLRCDLRINARRAALGGSESIRGAPGAARGEVIRIEGEGLPKLRGGCGDLLVRVVYSPEVRITRAK